MAQPKFAYQISDPVGWLDFRPWPQQEECRVRLSRRDTRSANTSRGYRQWQVEYLGWVKQNGKGIGLVTANLCAEFAKWYDEQSKESGRKWGPDQAQKYYSAMDDLYHLQRVLLRNDRANANTAAQRQTIDSLLEERNLQDPNADGIGTDLKQALRRRQAATVREEYQDPGRLLPELETLSEGNIASLCRGWMEAGTPKMLRDMALSLVNFRAGWRGEQTLNLRYVDMLKGFITVRDPKRQHPTPLRALVLFTLDSKPNQECKPELVALGRHVDPLVCPLGGLARQFVDQWFCGNESALDYTQARAWYDRRIWHGYDENKPLDDRQARRRTAAAMEQHEDITTRKRLHAGRNMHLQRAQDYGAELLDILVSQHRKFKDLESYAKLLPADPILAQLGVDAQTAYHCPRGDPECKPPPELRKMMETWVQRQRLELAGKKDGAGDETGNIKNAQQVSKALDELMVDYFLQDAAFLASQYPRQRCYQLPVFRHAMWPAYAAAVRRHCEIEKQRVEMERAANDPARLVRMLRCEVTSTLRQAVTVQAATMAPVCENADAGVKSCGCVCSCPAHLHTPATEPEQLQWPRVHPSPVAAPAPAAVQLRQADYQHYVLSPCNTVQDVLRQYLDYNGQNHQQQPSVEKANELWGTAWYKGGDGKPDQFDTYSRRRRIVEWCKLYARQQTGAAPTRASIDVAAGVLQGYVEEKKLGLRKLTDVLRKEPVLGVSVQTKRNR